MDDPRRPLRRQGGGQEVDQPVHRRDRIDLRSPVLLGPAPDLPLEIVARLAVIRQADLRGIEGVERRQRVDLGVVDRAAFRRAHAGQLQVPQNPPLDLFHDVEHRAHDRVVRAQSIRARHRETLRVQGGDHGELPVHGVRAGQQRAGRLATQHVGPVGRGQLVGRIGLAALELPDRQGPGVALDVRRQPGVQRAGIQRVARIDLACAGEGGLGIRLRSVCHGTATMAAFTAARQPFSRRSRSSAPIRGCHRAGASTGWSSRSPIRPTPRAASLAAPSAVIS